MELGRTILFPGRLKRKRDAYELFHGLLKESGKAREVEQKKRSDIFQVSGKGFSEKVREVGLPGLFVFGEDDCHSEIFFKGGVVAQVGQAPKPPEPERIHFLHRLQGKLLVFGRLVLAGNWE